MNGKTFGLALLAGLVAVASGASAEDAKNETEAPADGGNAWVEDCPPDMMCAFDAPSRDEPAGDGATCMDGEQEGESCRKDVQYMTPPNEDGAPEEDHVQAPEGSEGAITSVKDDAGEDAKHVPALGLVSLVGALAGAVALAARRRA